MEEVFGQPSPAPESGGVSVEPEWGCPVQGCKAQPSEAEEAWWLCPAHRGIFPPALLKASADNFDYAVGLQGGLVVRFETCVLHEGGWATLHGQTLQEGGDESWLDPNNLPYPCPRGLDIHVSRILWVADAPEGS